jgi:hypothetical protein
MLGAHKQSKATSARDPAEYLARLDDLYSKFREKVERVDEETGREVERIYAKYNHKQQA